MDWDDDDREEPVETGRKFNCGCPTGKSCFSSWRLARGEINRFRRGRATIRREGGYLAVYRCKICACLHIGNATKSLGGRLARSKKRKNKTPETAEERRARWKENLRKVSERLFPKKDPDPEA